MIPLVKAAYVYPRLVAICAQYTTVIKELWIDRICRRAGLVVVDEKQPAYEDRVFTTNADETMSEHCPSTTLNDVPLGHVITAGVYILELNRDVFVSSCNVSLTVVLFPLSTAVGLTTADMANRMELLYMNEFAKN